MEDENGLELSLGLSCGGSSAKLKGLNASSSDPRTDEGDKGSRLVDQFKSFLQAGTQNQDSGYGPQRADQLKPHENLFTNLSRTTVDADASSRGLWVANNSRINDAEEEKYYQHESSGKRKMLFDEITQSKKLEKDAHDASEKSPPMGIVNSTKSSHVSINTEDGSTAENEDVADSEVEGSTSKVGSHPEEGPKRYVAAPGPSEISKEIYGCSDSKVVNLQGQNRFGKPLENDFKLGAVTYGVAYAAQPSSMANVAYAVPVKESNSTGAPSSSGYPLAGMMQLLPPNGERPGPQHANSGNFPSAFGYSPVQLPMLDKENPWGLGSSPQQCPPLYTGKAIGGATPNPDSNNEGLKISQAMQVTPLASPEAKTYDGKQRGPEEGPSRTDNDAKGNNTGFRAKDASDQQITDVLSSERSAIRPGIAANVKFGGCGSFPNLPWVSTTGPGPNGKTISGVTYRFSTHQIKIVCACHGMHMTPEEFIQHAGEENTGTDGGAALPSFPGSNPASAQI